MSPRRRPSTLLVVVAFAAVYVIWGSTYLTIRLAIDTMPPLLMAGVRFLIAGGLLFPFAYLIGDRKGDRLTWRHWRSSFIIGALLLGFGNGGVTWGEQYVPSGVVALLVASVPLWMALFGHVLGVQRVTRLAAAGVVVGLVGVALLLKPEGSASLPRMLLVLVSPVCWAAGSLYARGALLPRRALVGVAMEMLCGGALLVLAAGVTGEWGRVHVDAISLESLLSLLYLVCFGSLIAYTAYVFLLGAVSPSAVSTYAYVNPLVAVVLGRVFLDEPLSVRTLAAGALIIVAVAVILAGRRRGRPRVEGQAPVGEAA